MIIFKKAEALSGYIQKQKAQGRSIGFVPTMGALHQGHLSLLQQCINENDITVCSIFINPTQFNNPDDFKKYPVTIEKDIQLLTDTGCSILFLPAIEEMYPAGHIKKIYDLGNLETILEGQYRPGHFQGVCEVVDRLLSIVHPQRIYLGQKDLQQCMVVKKMIQQEYDGMIALQTVPTMREKDGLAMSSRNLRLTPEQREKATAIYQTLNLIKNKKPDQCMSSVIEEGRSILKNAGFAVDYIAIANSENLALQTDEETGPKVALIAATIGNVRLIDNMVLN